MPGTDEQKRTIKGFAKAWEGMAVDLLSEAINDEYNALKHGLRVTLGGFRLEISRMPASGEKPEKPGNLEMVSLGGSNYGATFFKVEKLEGKGGRHLHSERTAVNWSPERDLRLLELAQFSIQNVVTALRKAHAAAPEACTFVRPVEDAAFLEPWKHSPGAISWTLDSAVDVSTLPEMKKAEMLQTLRAVKKPKK